MELKQAGVSQPGLCRRETAPPEAITERMLPANIGSRKPKSNNLGPIKPRPTDTGLVQTIPKASPTIWELMQDALEEARLVAGFIPGAVVAASIIVEVNNRGIRPSPRSLG